MKKPYVKPEVNKSGKLLQSAAASKASISTPA